MDLKSIFDAIEERGLFRAPQLVQSNDLTLLAIEGEVDVDDEAVSLRLEIPGTFPLTLPFFYVVPPERLGFVPHVLPNGYVCYLDSEGLVLDRRNPVGIIEEALSRTIALLKDGLTGVNRDDFANEFQAYWARLSNASSLDSVLKRATQPRWVLVSRISDNLAILADTLEEVGAVIHAPDLPLGKLEQRALYVPLADGTTLVPPNTNEPFWDAREVRKKLLPFVTPESKRLLCHLIERKAQNVELVVFDLPNADGGSTQFGIYFHDVGRNHPLLESGVAKTTQPVHIKRLDHGYIVARGGGNAELGTKRVLLVGCGAVGGPVAIELAHAGILDLTLVDFDKIGSENTFRHPLGWKYWGEYKVDGLKLMLENALPYVQIKPVKKSIIYALGNRDVDLSAFDAVIMATGDPTLELEINERLHALDHMPPVVYTWVEPLGIGGHALLSGNQVRRGCLECVYTPTDGALETALENRASFAASGQKFGRALNGCGTLHTPFGSLDAVRTATLAVRLVLDCLLGREFGNPLLSWKGDPTDFQGAGFRLSPRFKQSQDLLDELRYSYANERCRVCGSRDHGAG